MGTGKKVSPEYREYLESEGWAEKRLAALARAGHRCQLCNSKGTLEVHHRTCARIFNEAPMDLTVLCRECHHAHHKRQDEKKAKHAARAAKEKAQHDAEHPSESKSARRRRRRREADRGSASKIERTLTREEVERQIERKRRYAKVVERKLRDIKVPLERDSELGTVVRRKPAVSMTE